MPTPGTTGGSSPSPDEDDSATETSAVTTTDAGEASTSTGMPVSAGDTGSTGAGSDAGSSDGGEEDDSSSGAPVVGPQPDSGMWSHCTGALGCGLLLGCLVNADGTDGYCADLCTPAGNPASCGAGPVGTTVTCTTASTGESVCALHCADGDPCPGGMVCTTDEICM